MSDHQRLEERELEHQSKVGNALYAQSGGVTAVINTSAVGVIETAMQYPHIFPKIYAGRNGILGILYEDLFDLTNETEATFAALKMTPGGAFGSCRYKLKSFEADPEIYQRLFEVFIAHDIRYFFYNGGGDSQDTARKIAEAAPQFGHAIQCIGIPKTIDNDLPLTDNSPGFGSVAKYVAVSTLEASLDVASMAATSTKVFVLEVMGRHAGWIAAAAGLAKQQDGDGPHLILFPEVVFDPERFLRAVERCVSYHGYCVIVVSEGIKNAAGEFVAAQQNQDAFGHQQLGGVGPYVAGIIEREHGYKLHWAVADYLQRSARHIASAVDVEQAYAVGRFGVELALAGKSAVMPIIRRKEQPRYGWDLAYVNLSQVANIEKHMPNEFISEDGFHITQAAREYLEPLIQGEAYPHFEQGLPQRVRLVAPMVTKRLSEFNMRE